MSSDTVLKNYWSGNEEFADLFNAVLFGGSQIIRADELENEDTEDSVVLEHRKQAEGVKAARDNISKYVIIRICQQLYFSDTLFS